MPLRHEVFTSCLYGCYYCTKSSQCLINQISENTELFKSAKLQQLAADLIFFFKFCYFIANQLYPREATHRPHLSGEWRAALRQSASRTWPTGRRYDTVAVKHMVLALGRLIKSLYLHGARKSPSLRKSTQPFTCLGLLMLALVSTGVKATKITSKVWQTKQWYLLKQVAKCCKDFPRICYTFSCYQKNILPAIDTQNSNNEINHANAAI